jgi:membrane-associated phospholipid phosphatase
MPSGTGLWARLQSIDLALTRPLTLPPENRVSRFIALALAHSGDSFIWAALCAAAWFLGDAEWKRRAFITFAGLVLAEIVVIGVKTLIRRKRPPGDAGRIYRRADPFSFPSGHAARAALLCLLAGEMGPPAAFIAIALWSPFMVVARVAIGIHYVLDVAGGILLGWGLTAVLWALVPLFARWL